MFIARACGILPREAANLDAALLFEVKRLLGVTASAPADPTADQKVFLRCGDGAWVFKVWVAQAPLHV